MEDWGVGGGCGRSDGGYGRGVGGYGRSDVNYMNEEGSR